MIASQQLWTPAQSPLADLRDWWVMMTAGKRQRNGISQKLNRPTGGKFIRHNTLSSCCCACAGCATNTTPTSVDVVFSSTVVCNGTYLFPPLIVPASNYNGTYHLTRFGLCVWRYRESPGTTIAATASGVPLDFTVNLAFSGGTTWALDVWLMDPGSTPIRGTLYHSGNVIAGDCSAPQANSNNWTVCTAFDSVDNPRIVGKDGSASFTPNL